VPRIRPTSWQQTMIVWSVVSGSGLYSSSPIGGYDEVLQGITLPPEKNVMFSARAAMSVLGSGQMSAPRVTNWSGAGFHVAASSARQQRTRYRR